MQGVTAFEYLDVVSETNKSHTHLKQLVKHNVEETKNSPLRFLYLLYFTRFRLELSKCGDVSGGCEKSCGKSFLQPFLSFFLLRLLNFIPREKKTRRALTLHKLGPCNFLYHNLSPSSSYYYSTMTLRLPYNFVHYKFPRISVYTSHNICSIS